MKKFVMYIGGQNSNGFVNTEILRNDFNFEFTFNRADKSSYLN